MKDIIISKENIMFFYKISTQKILTDIRYEKVVSEFWTEGYNVKATVICQLK